MLEPVHEEGDVPILPDEGRADLQHIATGASGTGENAPGDKGRHEGLGDLAGCQGTGGEDVDAGEEAGGPDLAEQRGIQVAVASSAVDAIMKP